MDLWLTKNVDVLETMEDINLDHYIIEYLYVVHTLKMLVKEQSGHFLKRNTLRTTEQEHSPYQGRSRALFNLNVS
jgi:hypothetical protein